MSIEANNLLEVTGTIFDIQRFSIQDGPGIRTTVFLKGCPLTCTWCSNPESQKYAPQLLFRQHRCTRCYKCVEVCPEKANRILSDGSVALDPVKCNACGQCVEGCLGDARNIAGRVVTVGEVIAIAAKDSMFYRNSGGGLTASGGEALIQPAFLHALFRECRIREIDTALDTCGYAPWSTLDSILDCTDLVLFDIKHIDSEIHKELTGVSNELILENARNIVAKGVPIIIRVPLIPGLNDSEENIRGIAELSVELGRVEVNILPYHRFGFGKYEALGMNNRMKNVLSCADEDVKAISRIIRSYGVPLDIV